MEKQWIQVRFWRLDGDAFALLPRRGDEEQSSFMNATPIDDPTLEYSNWHSNTQLLLFTDLYALHMAATFSKWAFL